MSPKSTSALLYLSGVTVSFDGFKALNNLSLLVEPGHDLGLDPVPVARHLDRHPLATLVVVFGVARAFSGAAGGAIVPSLVDRPAIGSAVALNSAQFNLSRILGPALAGAAIALLILACNLVGDALRDALDPRGSLRIRRRTPRAGSCSVWVRALRQWRSRPWRRSAALEPLKSKMAVDTRSAASPANAFAAANSSSLRPE